MKKTMFIMVSVLAVMFQVVAQDNNYVPFVREGVKWVCYYDNTSWYPLIDQWFSEGRNYFTLEIKGDTVIDGKHYKPIHKYSGDCINTENDTIPLFLREENKTVFAVLCKYYHELVLGYGDELMYGPSIYEQMWSGDEFILYEFGDNTVAYYDSIFYRHHDIYHLCTDSITVGDKLAKREVFHWLDDWFIIDGIGYDGYIDRLSGYTLAYMISQRFPQPTYRLSHVIEDGKIIYKSVNYNSGEFHGIEEAVADGTQRSADPNYYNLMGQPVGQEVPTAPGIYIHQGKKIAVR